MCSSIMLGSSSPFTLARLAACNNEVQAIVLLHIKAAADTIIPAAAQQATEEGLSHCERCMSDTACNCNNPRGLHPKALGWLCRIAGPDALSTHDLARRLVSIRNPARFVIAALVDSGVRVPFDHLVDAAKAQVPGCEEWGNPLYTRAEDPWPAEHQIAVFISPKLQPELGEMLIDVCLGLKYSSFQPFPKLSPQHVVSLLHIALNTQVWRDDTYGVRSIHFAEELLTWLLRHTRGASYQEGLENAWQHHAAAMQQIQEHANEPDVLRQLLQTAVLRRHTAATALLCRMSATHQLSVEDAKGLITTALPVCAEELNHRPILNLMLELLEVLCRKLPAVQQLSVSDVSNIMQQIISTGLDNPDRTSHLARFLTIVCQHIPTARQLSVPCVVDMIYKVIKHAQQHGCQVSGVDAVLYELVALPSAQQIPQETAEDILHICLQQQVHCLFVKHPMQQLGVASVRSLLSEALDWYRLTQPMLDLPAAQQLSSDDVEQLLLAALAEEDIESVSLLCQHAVAAKLSPAAVGRLLEAAVQLSYCNSPALQSTLSLLRLGTVSMDNLVPAIRSAVCYDKITYLQPIVHSMCADMPYVCECYVLPEALRTAVLLRIPLTDILWFCGMPHNGLHAAHEQVAATAVCAILSGSPEAMRYLLPLPAPGVPNASQQLLALALFAQHRDGALMLAGECFLQRQLHEPWLPEVMRVALEYGRAGHAGVFHGLVASTMSQRPATATSSAAWPVAPQQQRQFS